MIHLIEQATILNNKIKYNSLQCELVTLQLLYDSLLDDLITLSIGLTISDSNGGSSSTGQNCDCGTIFWIYIE